MTRAQVVKKAFKTSLPVMAGYVVLAIGFSLLLGEKGFGFWWALAMSVFIYAGSMQYLTTGLLAGSVSLVSAAATTFMVNARHLFYGVSMLEKYKDMGPFKPYIIFGLTDETYSLLCSDAEDLPLAQRRLYYFLVSLFNQIYWVTGTVIGSVIGRFLPFAATGIDFALTALFVTVFVQQWKQTDDHVPALIGLGATTLCLALFGGNSFLIPAMLLISAALFALKVIRSRKQQKEDADE